MDYFFFRFNSNFVSVFIPFNTIIKVLISWIIALFFLFDGGNFLLNCKCFVSVQRYEKSVNIFFIFWACPSLCIVNLNNYMRYILYRLAIKIKMIDSIFMRRVNSCYTWNQNLMNNLLISGSFFFFWLHLLLIFINSSLLTLSRSLSILVSCTSFLLWLIVSLIIHIAFVIIFVSFLVVTCIRVVFLFIIDTPVIFSMHFE